MGQSLLNTHFAVGGQVVINNQFAYPAAVVRQLVSERVTGFSGVPATFAHLLYRSPLEKYREELTHLRYCSQAGGNMPLRRFWTQTATTLEASVIRILTASFI